MKSNKKIEASTRYALLDGISHTRLIQKSDLDWTIVRAPMLTEEPEKGKIEVVNVGQINGFKLSRADLAQFMLNEIEANKYIHQMPSLTNGN
jgi:putative NADH-flavin reductase